ncbi:MAG: transcriptional regulator [Arcobacteraceae bacterium]
MLFMTKREMAAYLDVDKKTLYNWEKFKPNLYKTVMKGLAFDEIVQSSKEAYEKAKKIQQQYDDIESK